MKSWYGLEMAVSVATGTPCLGRFAVPEPGPTLVYLAEDALPNVRDRLEGLCGRPQRSLDDLDLFVITEPVLRLDDEACRERLERTVLRYAPRLLLLDPLIRLHRLSENDSQEISGLLGHLRELQRRHGVSVVLVHHASKRRRAHPGQSLGRCSHKLSHFRSADSAQEAPHAREPDPASGLLTYAVAPGCPIRARPELLAQPQAGPGICCTLVVQDCT